MSADDLLFRRVRPDDLSFVYDSWLNTLRPEYRDMRDSDYFAWQRARIDRLLEWSTVVVCTPAEADNVIWAWMAVQAFASEPWRIHFIYVKPPHRGHGLARRLVTGHMPGAPMYTITAVTGPVREIKRAKPDLLRYIPA